MKEPTKDTVSKNLQKIYKEAASYYKMPFVDKDRKKIAIWCIFISAIVINVYLYFHILDNFPHLLNDFEMLYLLVSANLYKYGAYSFCVTTDCLPTLMILPVFTYIGNIVFLIFGLGEMAIEVIRIILILSNLGIIYITYRIGSLFNYKVGCVAAFLAASDLSMFCWANNFRPDMLYVFLFALSLYFFIKFIKVNQSRKNIILASFFLGLAALTKPGAYLLFCPLSVFLLFFLLRIKRIPLAKGFCYIGMFVVIQAAFIGGWTARNYYTEGTWVFCSQVGVIAFFYHGAHLKAYQDGIPFREAEKKMREEYETEKVKELDVNKRSVYYKGLLTRMILSSPLDYSVVILKYLDFLFLGSPPPDYLFSKQRREELFGVTGAKMNYEKEVLSKRPSLFFTRQVPTASHSGIGASQSTLKRLLGKGFYSYILLWGFIKAHLLIIYIMASIGIIVIFKEKSNRWVLLVMLLIPAYFVFTVGPAPSSRHRAIIMPIFYFLSSYGLVWVGEVLRKYKKRRSWNEKTS